MTILLSSVKKQIMKDKNKNLTYWWNLPIDELEEMADENGKIKKPKEESEEENNE